MDTLTTSKLMNFSWPRFFLWLQARLPKISSLVRWDEKNLTNHAVLSTYRFQVGKRFFLYKVKHLQHLANKVF